ncbi:glutamate racemase [Halarcobacter sp.]|uniref:glutamate racemase n=1 Tax=Halarcobacter sp. TaxID=2321133 RepID=UPI002AAB64EB|nr:glutamate racemase [Halarcobacter sp.]
MKVGVFDSGLGGLTIVQAITKSFKGAEIYYVADTLFAPYGEKTKDEILDRSIKITKHLLQTHNIDVLIVACNTATSAAITELREMFSNLIVIGTEPGLKPAILKTQSNNIAVLATPATLDGQKYKQLLSSLSNEHEVNIHEVACAGLVEQIENGNVAHPDTHKMLSSWLTPMKEKEVDTIVLGCTHYPLISDIIKDIMGAKIELIETGQAIARRLDDLCSKKGHIDKSELKIEVFYTGEIKKEMINMILNNWYDRGKIVIKDENE